VEIYLQFILLGIGAGVIYATLGLGLVMTYRASGVINFAYGAIAAYATYVFSGLESDGVYPIPPLPNPLVIIEWILSLFGVEWQIWQIPTEIQFSEPWSWWAAVAGALLTAGVIGFLFHYLVFRLLRYQPPLSRVVASVGLMIFLQATIVIRYGTSARVIPSLLPTNAIDIAGTRIPVDRFILFGLMIALTVALLIVYQRTKFGIRTRAAAENERSATLVGISADRVAAINWILAAILAGMVGILVAPITGLTPSNFTLFIIPALGAALLARFTSFTLAVAAGMAIGMGQSLLQIMELRLDSVPSINLAAGLPLLIIVVAMMFRGQVLPSRGAVERGRLPWALPTRIRLKVAIPWIVGTAAFLIWGPFDYRNATINTMIGAVLAMSLVVVTGFVGQISLAQLSLAGISAFALSSLAVDAGIGFPWAPLIAASISTFFGLLVAVPALRVRGASLAIMTLAAAVAFEVFLFRSSGFFFGDRPRTVDPPSLFGVEFGPNSPFLIDDGKVPSPSFGLFVLVVLIIVFLAVMRIRQSMLGEQMLAVRSNERAAAAAGISVPGIKFAAFGIASFLAGIGGALTAYKFGTYSMESFSVLGSLSLFAFSYLGGIATVSGAIYAGTLFPQGLGTYIIEDLIIDLGRYEAYLAGIFLVITALVQPEGIDGFDRRERRRIAWGFMVLWRKITGNPDRTKPDWVTRPYAKPKQKGSLAPAEEPMPTEGETA
jgi:ABC-type branched-subunit amino acid transport system permease subunit